MPSEIIVEKKLEDFGDVNAVFNSIQILSADNWCNSSDLPIFLILSSVVFSREKSAKWGYVLNFAYLIDRNGSSEKDFEVCLKILFFMSSRPP